MDTQAFLDQTVQDGWVGHAVNGVDEPWYVALLRRSVHHLTQFRRRDTNLIPLLIASLSATVLASHTLWSKVARHVVKKQPTEEATISAFQDLTMLERLKMEQGGSTISAFNLLRVLCIYSLAAVSLSQKAISKYLGVDGGSDANVGLFGMAALMISYVGLSLSGVSNG